MIPAQHAFINTSRASSTSNASYTAAKRGIADLTRALHATFAAHRLDALLYPEQTNLVVKVGAATQRGRNGILAALAGAPVVVVPAGVGGGGGVPVGVEVLGLPWMEARLLGIAAEVETLGFGRRMPRWAGGYAGVPVVVPEGTVLGEYPVGRLYT